MSYLKPQTPLQHKDGDYFYPLTTIDQVIMEDGITRLNGADLVSVNTDGAPEGETVKVNADTLDGISADEYATKIFVQNEIAEAQFDGSNLDDIKTYVNNQITNRVIHGGGKNLLKNTAKSKTINGITFTVNEDGSVTCDGSTSTNVTLQIPVPKLVVGQSYTLSGCPEDGSFSTYILQIAGFGSDAGTGFTGTWSDAIADDATVTIIIFAGATVSNLTFYPMLRIASEIDDTYEPYYEGLKEVHNKLSIELVWENASPASEFSGRTLDITVPSDATIGIIAGSYKDNAPSEFKMILRNRQSWIGLGGAGRNTYRTIEVTSNGIVISDAKYNSVYAGASDGVDNKFLIPYKIYIVRGVNL